MNNKENQFSIKQTVNKNIEKYQFPWFANHRSLIGWCSVTYPSVLEDPSCSEGPSPKTWDYDLDHIYQSPRQYTIGLDRMKRSCLTLATTKHDVKAQIFQSVSKPAQQYSEVRPLRCILGPNRDGKFDFNQRQLGEVSYVPSFESEQVRHLKKLPNLILNEQNLMQILNEHLQYLNLQSKNHIPNDLVQRIGHFAPNIKHIILASTAITDQVLIKLCQSLPSLSSLDISRCGLITSEGVSIALQNLVALEAFASNHNTKAICDASLRPLRKCTALRSLQISFCKAITHDGLDFLMDLEIKVLGLAGMSVFKSDFYQKVIQHSEKTLTEIDLSFNKDDINDQVLAKIAHCTQLETLSLTGCSAITDEGISFLDKGDKKRPKGPAQGFQHLQVLKVGGLVNVGDNLGSLAKKCQALEFIEANNLEKLTEGLFEYLRNHPSLASISLNFTPNISDLKIQEIRETHPGLKVIRNINKMTDPNQKVLKMPVPSDEVRNKKLAAGNKKSKK